MRLTPQSLHQRKPLVEGSVEKLDHQQIKLTVKQRITSSARIPSLESSEADPLGGDFLGGDFFGGLFLGGEVLIGLFLGGDFLGDDFLPEPGFFGEDF